MVRFYSPQVMWYIKSSTKNIVWEWSNNETLTILRKFWEKLKMGLRQSPAPIAPPPPKKAPGTSNRKSYKNTKPYRSTQPRPNPRHRPINPAPRSQPELASPPHTIPWVNTQGRPLCWVDYLKLTYIVLGLISIIDTPSCQYWNLKLVLAKSPWKNQFRM